MGQHELNSLPTTDVEGGTTQLRIVGTATFGAPTDLAQVVEGGQCLRDALRGLPRLQERLQQLDGPAVLQNSEIVGVQNGNMSTCQCLLTIQSNVASVHMGAQSKSGQMCYVVASA